MTAAIVALPPARPRAVSLTPDFDAIATGNPAWSLGILRGMALYRRLHADGMRSGPLALAGAERHDQVAALYDAAAAERYGAS